ncbi:hypothetical protein C818_02254 [Lachnospiraceae bacterium MD308]|nr:hypothetical protein C818_02254 [Lachnospiraceae bacterium MD308]MCI8504446.1 relaxase/mobilization nuclease domain-containing protein [Dorea sp.]
MERVVIRIPDGTYENYNAVDNVIAYILRLDNIRLVGGYGIILTNAKDIIRQFYKVKYYYGKTDGKQIRHYIFSVEKTLYFSPWQVKELGYLLGLYFGNEHQVVFAVHDDSRHLHIHMGINTVAYTNGAYRAYWEIEGLRAYAEKCVDLLTDRVWFGKEMNLGSLKVW